MVVISNPAVCDIRVFHAMVFGDKEVICDARISLLAFLKPKFVLKLR